MVGVCGIDTSMEGVIKCRGSPGGGIGVPLAKLSGASRWFSSRRRAWSMADPPPTRRTVHFENFEFDFRSGELREHGHKVKVEGQPLQILAVLLDRPGELVTRDELRNKL